MDSFNGYTFFAEFVFKFCCGTIVCNLCEYFLTGIIKLIG
jgi:hypothetical protein